MSGIYFKFKACSYFMACGALVTSHVHAYEPLNTDDSGTLRKNSNQIEQYFDVVNNYHQTPGVRQGNAIPGEDLIGKGSSTFFPFTYTRGLADDLELSVGATYYARPRGNYSPISNKTLAVKWRYFGEDGVGLNLAIKPMIQMPVGVSQQVAGLGQASTNYGSNFIASNYWGDSVELHANLMYVYSPCNRNYATSGSTAPLRANVFTISVAPVFKVSPGLNLALDVGAQTNPSSTDSYQIYYGMVAAIVKLNDQLDVGLSIQRSSQNVSSVVNGRGSNATRSYFGITWRYD